MHVFIPLAVHVYLVTSVGCVHVHELVHVFSRLTLMDKSCTFNIRYTTPIARDKRTIV